MQTFLPYPDFKASAAVLDPQRLNKQIVEGYQILKAITDPSYGWQNHPAVNQWRGCEMALFRYVTECHNEWQSRYKIPKVHQSFLNTQEYFYNWFRKQEKINGSDPLWLNYEPFHASHRSNLLRKDPIWYGQFGWKESDNLPYYWPSKQFDWKEKEGV